VSGQLGTDAFIAFGLIVVVPLVLWAAWRNRVGWWRGLVVVAFAAYVVVIIGLVFTPFPLPPWTAFTDAQLDSSYRPWPFPWLNILPFDTIRGALRFGVQWQPGRYLLGNVLAFAPFGVFLPVLWPRWRSLIGIFVAAIAISIAIEAVQLGLSLLMGFPYRVADIDDVLLNVLGVTLGYVVYRAVVAVLPSPRSVQPAP
jgi:glycopeptide antibiotics resistance protein